MAVLKLTNLILLQSTVGVNPFYHRILLLIELLFNEIIMNEITEFLRNRRSVVIRNLTNQPVPQADLDLIIDCGMRVPDHAVLAPWRLVVILPTQACHLGTTILAPEFKRLNPEATEAMLIFEEGRFARTGAVIAVLSCPQPHQKIPVWEMQLSAGAVCQNLLSSALALGYGAQWVTEWYAYNDKLLRALGGNPETDKFAGFIYIGTKNEDPKERRRPDKKDVVSYYTA